jgi:hypothetical protein
MFVTVSSQDLDFKRHMSRYFVVFSDFSFCDIAGIVDHRCLNFLFKITNVTYIGDIVTHLVIATCTIYLQNKN